MSKPCLGVGRSKSYATGKSGTWCNTLQCLRYLLTNFFRKSFSSSSTQTNLFSNPTAYRDARAHLLTCLALLMNRRSVGGRRQQTQHFGLELFAHLSSEWTSCGWTVSPSGSDQFNSDVTNGLHKAKLQRRMCHFTAGEHVVAWWNNTSGLRPQTTTPTFLKGQQLFRCLQFGAKTMYLTIFSQTFVFWLFSFSIFLLFSFIYPPNPWHILLFKFGNTQFSYRNK